MKLSARNVIQGKIKSVKKGPISTLVVLEIAPGVELASVITSDGAGCAQAAEGPVRPTPSSRPPTS
jgi:molybdopterin-binding protein